MERIRGNILTRLGLTEPLDSSEPLTVDEEAVVATFREYQMAKVVKNMMKSQYYIEQCTMRFSDKSKQTSYMYLVYAVVQQM